MNGYRFRRFLPCLSVSIICACANRAPIDINQLTLMGQQLGLGQVILAARCEATEVTYGIDAANFIEGICIVYPQAFVFRMVDKGNSEFGKNFTFKFSDIQAYSLHGTETSVRRQFQLRMNDKMFAAWMRPDPVLGAQLEVAKKFAAQMESMKVREVASSSAISPRTPYNSTVVVIPRSAKKK